MSYTPAHRRARAIGAYSMGAIAARPKVSDPKNPRCRGRIALDDGEVDFRYHRCEELITKTAVRQGLRSDAIAKLLKRPEADVIVILADLLIRGEI